jgi:hypothetical protein
LLILSVTGLHNHFTYISYIVLSYEYHIPPSPVTVTHNCFKLMMHTQKEIFCTHRSATDFMNESLLENIALKVSEHFGPAY